MRNIPDVNLVNTQKGTVLIESLLAILIFAFGILALVGLQAAMVKNTSDNKFRSDASFLAQQMIGQMWGDSGDIGTADLARFVGTTDVSGFLPSGTRTVVIGPPAGLVTVTVKWTGQDNAEHNYTTSTYINARYSK